MCFVVKLLFFSQYFTMCLLLNNNTFMCFAVCCSCFCLVFNFLFVFCVLFLLLLLFFMKLVLDMYCQLTVHDSQAPSKNQTTFRRNDNYLLFGSITTKTASVYKFILLAFSSIVHDSFCPSANDHNCFPFIMTRSVQEECNLSEYRSRTHFNMSCSARAHLL